MNAEKLYMNVCESLNKHGDDELSTANDALLDYGRSHCYRPISLKIYNSHLGIYERKLVPCGQCYHCVQTKVNEWATRLYAHLTDYKYCYFLTLTYRSFPEHCSPFEQFLMEYLGGSFFNLDNYNYTHEYGYHPCVLYKKHYQDFLKRLRKNTNNNSLTYFGCGEYGHNYGRPHYHFILFSNQVITLSECEKAWSLDLTINNGAVSIAKNNFNVTNFSFGRVELDDLFANGTITKEIINVDGSKLNSRACFQYVAKYVGKREFNTKRLKLYYDYVQQFQIPDLPGSFSSQNEMVNSNFADFCKVHRPFIAVSRGTPIGSIYFERHAKEMADGNFRKPDLQNATGYVVPSYFRRKASEYIYSLRVASRSNSACKGELPLIASKLASYASSEIAELVRDFNGQSSQNYGFLPQQEFCYVTRNLKQILKSPDCFIDVRTNARFVICFDKTSREFISSFVAEYRYKRGKGWLFYASHSLETWCNHYLTRMHTDLLKYLEIYKLSKQQEVFYNLVYEYYMEFAPDKWLGLASYIEDKNKEYLNLKNGSRYQNSKL